MKTKKKFFSKLLLTGIFLLIISSCENKKDAGNPLLDTQWSGIGKIPMAEEIILKFSKDKMDVILENKVIESTRYEVKGNQINFSKISGGSPCEVGAKGNYSFEITGDKLTIDAVTDECVARTKSLKGSILTRIEP
ncbi:hypothetical protein OMO38_07640 [Chryseobacterium sp. 09-1422]|uniref:Lipocalin-like domain-containing protein n=1 Tax=Chryseobacterium kimseyorum TaxID=2984028 RepID=A0ABT3HX64_9FLAO|nr:hypothetical protein [Chryseobacterium kimseyorum]MCW3168397.1 hypothetical protein [Chryseobacterium kimseyorum]